MKINHKNHVIHYTRCPQFASHYNMQANPERHFSVYRVLTNWTDPSRKQSRSTCTHLQFRHKAGGVGVGLGGE